MHSIIFPHMHCFALTNVINSPMSSASSGRSFVCDGKLTDTTLGLDGAQDMTPPPSTLLPLHKIEARTAKPSETRRASSPMDVDRGTVR